MIDALPVEISLKQLADLQKYCEKTHKFKFINILFEFYCITAQRQSGRIVEFRGDLDADGRRTYDALAGRFRHVRLRRNPACASCRDVAPPLAVAAGNG
jgi:hypothetical protein